MVLGRERPKRGGPSPARMEGFVECVVAIWDTRTLCHLQATRYERQSPSNCCDKL